MSPRLPYWLRLVLAFLTVIALAAGGAALLGSRLALAEMARGADAAAAGRAAALRQALVIAAAVSAGAALLVALGLTRLLCAPWRALAAAAEALATKRGLSVGAKGDEEVRLEQSLRSITEALEQQEAVRQQLLADIAHELRTPLAVIRGNLEAILDGIYCPSRETVAPIHEEVLLLARLVDDLRDLALAQAGQLRLHVAHEDLTELVRGVLAGFQAQASERSIELLLVLPPSELPRVEIDAARIRQVLVNLISNALRHVPQRGRVRVALRRASPRFVEVRVSDNGPGISPEDLPHVFSRFHRGERARALDRSGSGLGLAIARHWVEAHGGSIRVESALGEGTTFIFTLPVS